ncbi:hypothetical protein BO99DRAFT_484631, partial [Aspergillus violaceofuscus CBS 115571]
FLSPSYSHPPPAVSAFDPAAITAASLPPPRLASTLGLVLCWSILLLLLLSLLPTEQWLPVKSKRILACRTSHLV